MSGRSYFFWLLFLVSSVAFAMEENTWQLMNSSPKEYEGLASLSYITWSGDNRSVLFGDDFGVVSSWDVSQAGPVKNIMQCNGQIRTVCSHIEQNRDRLVALTSKAILYYYRGEDSVCGAIRDCAKHDIFWHEAHIDQQGAEVVAIENYETLAWYNILEKKHYTKAFSVDSKPWSLSFVSQQQGNKLLLIGFFDGKIMLYDYRSDRLVGSVKAHSGHIEQIIPIPNTSCFASTAQDKMLKLFDLRTLSYVSSESKGSSIQDVSVSPNGKFLAWGSGKNLVIYDLQLQQREVISLPGDDFICKTAFSTNEAMLAGVGVRKKFVWGQKKMLHQKNPCTSTSSYVSIEES